MSNNLSVPIIHRLTIDRFRGINHLEWHPEPGVNLVLGGGDTGKSTILEAIALLLSPTYSIPISDTDYYLRDVEKEFCIEAVMHLPPECGVNQQAKNAWPWEWDGENIQLPKVEERPEGSNAKPVYRVRVRGSSEFELLFEIVQPNDLTDHFAVAIRRQIGLVRLSGDDRNDRDLRLVQGSALDRLLSDKALRAKLGQKLADNDVQAQLGTDAAANLAQLDKAFSQKSLPTPLGLGLTGSQGLSFGAMIGLTATREGVRLPLSAWGSGTRRLSALEVAATHQGDHPIIVVDEVERGLEPYRQRVLMSALENAGSQVFVTTHSTTVVSSIPLSAMWYMDSNRKIGKLAGETTAHRTKDPETFLARVAIIAEGATEVGFVRFLLEKAIGGDLRERGLWITDGGGNDSALGLLSGLVDSGLAFAGFVDNEGSSQTRWRCVKDRLGELLFRWPSGCPEENIIGLVSEDQLEDFIKDDLGESGERRRTLADRLGIVDKDFAVIRAKTPNLQRLIIEAATGAIPESGAQLDASVRKTWKKHGQIWFKTEERGRELAAKILRFGLWPKLKDQILPFLNAIRKAVDLPPIGELPHE